MLEVDSLDYSLVQKIDGCLIKDVVNSCRGQLWLQLGEGPLKLTNVLDLIQMEILEDNIFNLPPQILLVHFGFESEV